MNALSRDAMPRGGRLSIGTGRVQLGEDDTRRGHGALPGAYATLTKKAERASERTNAARKRLDRATERLESLRKRLEADPNADEATITLRLIATGALGLAIVIYMFVRELGPA